MRDRRPLVHPWGWTECQPVPQPEAVLARPSRGPFKRGWRFSLKGGTLPACVPYGSRDCASCEDPAGAVVRSEGEEAAVRPEGKAAAVQLEEEEAAAARPEGEEAAARPEGEEAAAARPEGEEAAAARPEGEEAAAARSGGAVGEVLRRSRGGFHVIVEKEAGLCGFSGFAHPAAPCQEKEELSAACWRLEPVAPRLASLWWVAATETAERQRGFSGFARPAAPCQEKAEPSAACWRLEPVWHHGSPRCGGWQRRRLQSAGEMNRMTPDQERAPASKPVWRSRGRWRSAGAARAGRWRPTRA
ncbi:uncharacterized protein LOC135273973 [Aotus nancymaae]|uniref:uncharacterized protein LOC135273973 n=1 Tax=Aotus nancymaae TaxID=37293 RepID=UPI0030FEDC78